MATKLPALPTSEAPVSRPATGRVDPGFYRYLRGLDQKIRELESQNEQLRVALNEARQNPTTVYPAITFP